MSSKQQTPEHLPVLLSRERAILKACLDHAQDLIEEAEALVERGKPHLAYHFAVLALEELGKRTIFEMNALSKLMKDTEVVSSARLEDHVAKLFWAFFGRGILSGRVNRSEVEKFRGLASHLHNRRQDGIYVDTESHPFRRPSRCISRGEARNAVALAKANCELERLSTQGRPTLEGRENAAWFLRRMEDSHYRKIAFSPGGLKQLAEFENFARWIEWLKLEDEKGRIEIEAQFNEPKSHHWADVPGGEPRWETRIRLCGVAHSLRQSVFKEWNEEVKWCKFQVAGAKNKELILSITAGEEVTLREVYLAHKALSERIIIALNISTFGLFWREVPQYTSRFFDSIRDLKDNREIILEHVPNLRINWNAGRLDSDDLKRLMVVGGALPFPSDGEYGPFRIYLDGIAFMTGINLLRRHEYYAFRSLYQAFWDLAGLSHGEPIIRSKEQFFSLLPYPFNEVDEFESLFEKGEVMQEQQVPPDIVDLRDVGHMKRAFDGLALHWCHERFRQALAKREVTDGKGDGWPE